MIINPFRKILTIKKIKEICKDNNLFIYDINESPFIYSLRIETRYEPPIQLAIQINWFHNKITLIKINALEPTYTYSPIQIRNHLLNSYYINLVSYSIDNQMFGQLNDYINSYLIINKLAN